MDDGECGWTLQETQRPALFFLVPPTDRLSPLCETPDGKTIVEYFDAKSLAEFLYHRQKANVGILQRFVEPRGVYNSTSSAEWEGRWVDTPTS